jgi:hypothetical protein
MADNQVMNELITRARAIRARFQRLAANDHAPEVHFHQGPQGQPAPCFDGGCSNPRLSV